MNSYKNILSVEFKNCFKSKKFRFTFCIMLLMITIGSILSCKEYYGGSLSSIRGAYQMSFIQGIDYKRINGYIISTLPLIASIIYSDSLLVEYDSGVYKNIITRVDKKKYLISKLIVIITVVFLTMFIVLLISEIFSLIAFPIEGIDNNCSLPSYDIGYQNYQKKWLFDRIRLQSPYFYNLIFITVISLFGSLFAGLSYSISLVVKWKRLFILSFVYILYTIYEAILPWSLVGFSFSNIISDAYKATLVSYVLLILAVLIPEVFLFLKGLKKELY